MPFPAAVMRRDGRVLSTNARFDAHIGLGDRHAEDDLQTSFAADRPALRAAVDAAGHGGCAQLRLRRGDGPAVPVTVELSPLGAEARAAAEFLAVVRDAAPERSAVQRLRESQDVARLVVWELDPRSGALRMPDVDVAFPAARLPGECHLNDVLSLIPEPHASAVRRTLEEVGQGATGPVVLRYPVRLPDGTEISVETRAQADLDAAGQTLRIRGTTQDLTVRQAAEEAVNVQAHLLNMLDAAVVAITLDGTVTHWNDGAELLYGVPRENAIGRHVSQAIADADPSGIEAMIATTLDDGCWDGERVLVRAGGERVPRYVRLRRFVGLDGRPAGIVGVAVDISDQIARERELATTRDHLRTVMDSVGEGLYTLDETGHVQYMNPAAERLLGWRREDLAGTDLHAAVHRGAHGHPAQEDDCPMIAAGRDGKVVHLEDEQFLRRDGTLLPVKVTAAPFATNDDRQWTVVVFGDISRQKAEKRRLDAEIERLSWAARVRDALAEDRLLIHAQPIMDLATGMIAQHELLVRLREADGHIVPPGRFLPAAESTGLVVDIDRFVRRQALELACAGHAVEVNVSARSLTDPSILEEVCADITGSGANPALVVFELTETALLDNRRAGRAFIDGVRDLGCGVALDDFGTGYGGFTYLKHLPVDYLKIDTEFVRDLARNDASRHVVEAVVRLARCFGQRTIAEGVEDDESLRLLGELGVDYAQGYRIARPMSISRALATAAAWRPRGGRAA